MMDRKEPSLFIVTDADKADENKNLSDKSLDDRKDFAREKSPEVADNSEQVHSKVDGDISVPSKYVDNSTFVEEKLTQDNRNDTSFANNDAKIDSTGEYLAPYPQARAKKAGGSGIFILVFFVALAFICLISLAFWQWEHMQKTALQIDNLNKVLNQVSEDISFVNKDSDDKATSLKQSLTSLNASVKSLTGDIKKQKNITSTHYKKIADLTKSLTEVQTNLNAAQKELATLTSNLQAQIAQLAENDKSLSKQVRGATQNVGELSLSVEALTNKLNKISLKDITDLQYAKSQIDVDIKSLKITTNRLTRQVEALLKKQ